jgi:hypothetical protein
MHLIIIILTPHDYVFHSPLHVSIILLLITIILPESLLGRVIAKNKLHKN